MVNEALAELLDLTPGGHLEVAPLSDDEISVDSASLAPQLPVTDMEVAGVVRVGADLVEPQTQGSLATIEAAMFLGPAWAEAMASSDYYRYQTGIGLWLDDGADVEALVDEAAPGQLHVVEGGLTADDTSGPSETVDYQARAALATAALLALAGMVLVGQILGRQARRELADADTLRALGMTRRGLTSSAVPRWIATAAVAGAVAVVTAVLIRPLGPVGIARRAAGCRTGGEPGRGRSGRARRRGLRRRDRVARDLSRDGGPQVRTNTVVRLHSTVAPVGRGVGRHGAHRERRPGASLVGRPGGPGQRGRHRRGRSPCRRCTPASTT